MKNNYWINIGHFETVHELSLHDYPIVEHLFDEHPVKLIKLTDIDPNPKTLDQDDQYFTLEVSIEYTKEIRELIYWQNMYTCASDRQRLYSSTLEALWKYFYNIALESGKDKDKARAFRLHLLANGSKYAFCYLTRSEAPWIE